MELILRNFRQFVSFAVIIYGFGLSGCKKNDIDEGGSIQLKVVNAVPEISDVGFTLANNVLVTGGLDFAEYSVYMDATPGTRLVGEFRSGGSSISSSELYLPRGAYYTVFLVGEKGSTRIRYYDDEVSAPSTGKVKIRFINFSDALPDEVNVKTSEGKLLASSLIKDLDSQYSEVDAGDLTLQFSDSFGKSVDATVEITGLEENHTYSIYIVGNDLSTLIAQKVVHN